MDITDLINMTIGSFFYTILVLFLLDFFHDIVYTIPIVHTITSYLNFDGAHHRGIYICVCVCVCVCMKFEKLAKPINNLLTTQSFAGMYIHIDTKHTSTTNKINYGINRCTMDNIFLKEIL